LDAEILWDDEKALNAATTRTPAAATALPLNGIKTVAIVRPEMAEPTREAIATTDDITEKLPVALAAPLALPVSAVAPPRYPCCLSNVPAWHDAWTSNAAAVRVELSATALPNNAAPHVAAA
jgi:hypothetical protein